MAKILVVDDEAVLVKGIRFNLQQEGYQVETGSDGEQAVELAREGSFDLVILDLMMPKIDGLQACMRIREFSNVPIIMLTAKGEDTDKIIGFECGADDYITKPFNPLEMTARVNAAVRRYAAAGKTEVLKLKDLELDTSSCRLTKGGETIALTAKEYKILLLLMLSPGRIFSKKQIMVAVDGEDWLDDTAIAVHISHLRAKLETDGEAYIRTIKGLGYKIEN